MTIFLQLFKMFQVDCFVSYARSSVNYNAPLEMVQEENHGQNDDRLMFNFVLGWDEGCLSQNQEYVVGIGLYASKKPCVPGEKKTMVLLESDRLLRTFSSFQWN